MKHIQSLAVERCQKNGSWIHPKLQEYLSLNFCGVERLDDSNWSKLEKDLNIDLVRVEIEDDADNEICFRFFDEGDGSALIDWNPTPPDSSKAWILIRVFEHEDGAGALWACEKSKNP